MSLAGKKRPAPSSHSKTEPRKKYKADAKSEKQRAKNTQPSKRDVRDNDGAGKRISLENLKWQEVQVPEHLDDYEGFFGLEEIDGVDVVKPVGGGIIEYKVVGKATESVMKDVSKAEKGSRPEKALKSKTSAAGAKKAKVYEAVEGGKVSSSVAPEEVEGVNDEAWSGFGSEEAELDEVDPEVPTEDESDSADDAESRSKSKQSENIHINGATADEDVSLSGFGLLDGYEDDEDAANISEWHKLDLSPDILGALSQLKFASPTPIQAAAIPQIIEGNDMVGKAPTGSGKTLAFGIPIVEEWLRQRRLPKKQQQKPVALIVEPTRELAQQVNDHMKSLCSTSDLDQLSICTLTGGLSIQKQRRLLALADVVVATPGRLWEVISEGHGVLESLRQAQYLVIDEADRLLSQGHFKELEQFLDALTRTITTDDTSSSPTLANATTSISRQTLVFSATFSKDLQHKLSHRQFSSSSATKQDSMAYLLRKLPFQPTTKPTFIDVSPTKSMASNLREGILECPGPEKDLYLYTLLLHHAPGTRALIFVNSIPAVQRLVPFLENLQIKAYPLHSHMEQKQRLRTIERFSGSKTPKVPRISKSTQTNSNTNANTQNGTANPATPKKHVTALIATDIAARGLDIPAIDLVLHYHVPRTADAYIHRSGRTARASASGTSILLCDASEAAGVRRLVAKVHGIKTKKASAKGVLDGSGNEKNELRTLGVSPQIVTRLKPRAVLSKKIADALLSKVKTSSEDAWINAAAEELGLDLSDADVVEAFEKGGRGRGQGRKKREKEAAGMSKAEIGALKAELRELLGRRINAGVSERYLAGGGVDMGALVREREMGAMGMFLGSVEDLGF